MTLARRAHFAQLTQRVAKPRTRCRDHAQTAHPVTQQIERAIVVECDQRVMRQRASFVARERVHIDARELVE
ncbi:hypothetical protein [Paraburkholderia sp. BCC1884]|uniref:hypothetical protein n=1 Tax=Paraburkholderia sp. BCC1884 TaxID=2562668 RepID=UPI00391F312C